MTYGLVPTPAFLRASEKFKRAHPNLSSRLARVLRELEDDPFQPHLRLHSLTGQLAGLRAVSVTYEYRITLTLDSDAQRIVLRDIGSHEEVYR